jgi:hypothetical protein
MKFRLEGLKEIGRIVKELAVGLRNLDFSNNFDTLEISDIIDTGSTIIVRNKFNALPEHWIVTDNTGDGVISRGSTWDENYLSFKNNGTVEATVKIMVYRR